MSTRRSAARVAVAHLAYDGLVALACVLAVPPWIVTVPHVRASAGPTPTPSADTRSTPTRARPVTRLAFAPPPGAAARRPIPWAMSGG